VIRVPGQLPAIAGAVSHGGLVVTSGVISPALLGPGPAPGIAAQLDGAVQALSEVLDRAGSDLAHAIRIEAFLARAEDFPRWNEVFAAAWPADPPARTTLIAGFALPAVLVELQAIAALRSALPQTPASAARPRYGEVPGSAFPDTGWPMMSSDSAMSSASAGVAAAMASLSRWRAKASWSA